MTEALLKIHEWLRDNRGISFGKAQVYAGDTYYASPSATDTLEFFDLQGNWLGTNLDLT